MKSSFLFYNTLLCVCVVNVEQRCAYSKISKVSVILPKTLRIFVIFYDVLMSVHNLLDVEM